MLLLVSNQNPNSTLPDIEVYRGGNERLYTDKFDELTSLINQNLKKKKIEGVEGRYNKIVIMFSLLLWLDIFEILNLMD